MREAGRIRQRPYGAHSLAAALLIIALAAMPVHSDEDPPTHSPTVQVPRPRQSLDEQGKLHHAHGLYYRDKALELESRLRAAKTNKARHKLSKKIIKNYRLATGEFEDALRLFPAYYPAATGLGFVLRKIGEYPESLEACQLALSMAPADGEALACLAEAYMAMGQLEDAKAAYFELDEIDRTRSDQLLKSMQVWLDRQIRGPSEIPPSILEFFAEWLDEQAGI
jgi:tetratricopeptide (TPR) repeat protein